VPPKKMIHRRDKSDNPDRSRFENLTIFTEKPVSRQKKYQEVMGPMVEEYKEQQLAMLSRTQQMGRDVLNLS